MSSKAREEGIFMLAASSILTPECATFTSSKLEDVSQHTSTCHNLEACGKPTYEEPPLALQKSLTATYVPPGVAVETFTFASMERAEALLKKLREAYGVSFVRMSTSRPTG